LYSDLRKESLTHGGIPITVRHLESMIRMAEAHARMHLRDSVRSDDVDLAIRVMLESFISAQKYSVMKSLRRTFARYLVYRRDDNELLLFLLQELLRETLKYYHYRYGDENMPAVVEIDTEDFETRAKELNVHDTKPFYKSKLFSAHGYRLNEKKRVIERDN
jgi:DNA replication licensing factor MCM2